jgi:hypothetical protein
MQSPEAFSRNLLLLLRMNIRCIGRDGSGDAACAPCASVRAWLKHVNDWRFVSLTIALLQFCVGCEHDAFERSNDASISRMVRRARPNETRRDPMAG